MGIAVSTDTRGSTYIITNVTAKVRDGSFKTSSGLFASINLDGNPMARGLYGETYL